MSAETPHVIGSTARLTQPAIAVRLARMGELGRILPEHQRLEVGQALDRAGNMLAKACDHEHFLVLGPPGSLSEVESTWTLGLYPIDGGTDPARLEGPCPGCAYRSMVLGLLLLLDPGQFLMERRMLLGIKQRAERR